jgi:hypothetical protein
MSLRLNWGNEVARAPEPVPKCSDTGETPVPQIGAIMPRVLAAIAFVLYSQIAFAESPTTAPAAAPTISGKLGTPIQLFNGKDLTGWTWFARPPKGDPATQPSAKLEDVWSVHDGVLHDVGKPTGYVYSNKEFSNYRLIVEQRHIKKGNGGILIAVRAPEKVWPKCIEVQGGSGGEGDMYNHGSYKFTVDPARLMKGKAYGIKMIGPASAKPIGEWDTIEVVVDHGKLWAIVNGQLQNVVTDAEDLTGQIGLQAEGGEMEFRKVELTPIE